MLLPLFINDLPDGVKSDVCLFADDTKMFRNIADGEDKEILQDDLENLENWNNTWLLKFHPENCKHMNIARVEKTDEFKYKLSGKNFERVQKEKVIGISGYALAGSFHVYKEASCTLLSCIQALFTKRAM